MSLASEVQLVNVCANLLNVLKLAMLCSSWSAYVHVFQYRKSLALLAIVADKDIRSISKSIQLES